MTDVNAIWTQPIITDARGKIFTLPAAYEGVAYGPINISSTLIWQDWLNNIWQNQNNYDWEDLNVDLITYTLIDGSLPEGITLDLDGTISGTPTAHDVVSHNHEFVIRATTPMGDIADRTFQIYITASNLSPYWITSPGLLTTISAGTDLNLAPIQLNAADPDLDELFYHIVSGALPPGTFLNNSTGEIFGVPNDFPGTYTFSISVTDTILSDVRSFSIEITSAALNFPPVWVTPSGSLGAIDENSPSAFVLQAIDVNGDTLFYTLALALGESFPPGLTLQPSGAITGIVGLVSMDTTYTFTVNVTDNVNSYVPRTFSITVNTVSGVLPPFWVTPAGSLGQMWEFYTSTFAVEAQDSNDLPITYTVTAGALPSGLSLDTLTGLIIGIPDTVDVNTDYTFTIRASNGTYYIDREFSLTVMNFVEEDVLSIIADLVTGDDRLDMEEFTNELLLGNSDKVFRPNDPNFGAGQHLQVYLISGIPIWPTGFNPLSPPSPYEAHSLTPGDVFYKILSDDPDFNATGALDVVPERSLGSFNYKATVLMNNIKYASARAFFNGDVLYDVIYVDLIDPQESGYRSLAVGDGSKQTYATPKAVQHPNFLKVRVNSIQKQLGVDFTLVSNSTAILFNVAPPVNSKIEISVEDNYKPDLLRYDTTSGYVISQSPDGLNDPGIAYPPKYTNIYNQITPPHDILNKVEPIIINGTNSNTEDLDFITPNSLRNMRQYILENYGGFAVDVDNVQKETLPLWMGSEQIVGDVSSVIGWIPSVVIAFTLPGTAKTIVENLTTEQKNKLKGTPVIIDRHLIYTTPVLTPTTTFSDIAWPEGTTFDSNTTTFGSNFTLDIGNSPFIPCTFDFDGTRFDSVGVELFTKYIKFAPGDKFYDELHDRTTHQLLMSRPAIDSKN
jgi:hypothetical protein